MEEIISNGDMIREMTDKELARILMELHCQKHCKSMFCTLRFATMSITRKIDSNE